MINMSAMGSTLVPWAGDTHEHRLRVEVMKYRLRVEVMEGAEVP